MIAKRDSEFNEKIAENRAAEQERQGGGELTINDTSTKQEIKNDNSQSMLSQIEPPLNRRRMRGGYAGFGPGTFGG